MEVPEKIIASVPVPDASHINLIPVVSVRNGTPVGNVWKFTNMVTSNIRLLFLV